MGQQEALSKIDEIFNVYFKYSKAIEIIIKGNK